VAEREWLAVEERGGDGIEVGIFFGQAEKPRLDEDVMSAGDASKGRAAHKGCGMELRRAGPIWSVRLGDGLVLNQSVDTEPLLVIQNEAVGPESLVIRS
jgi:hypothetical protein